MSRRKSFAVAASIAAAIVLVLWNSWLRQGDEAEPMNEEAVSATTRAVGAQSLEHARDAGAAASTAVELTGQVVDTFGNPAMGATIEAWAASDADPQRPCRAATAIIARTASATRGEFTLELAEESLYCIRARDSRSMSDAQVASTGDQRTSSLRLILQALVEVNGRVVDATRTAIPGVTLALERNDGPPQDALHATANSDGRLRFVGVAAGEYSLRAADGRYVVSTPRQIRVDRAQPMEELQVRVAPATAIRGRILDANGKPLANVRVRVRSPYDPELSLGGAVSDRAGVFSLLSEHRREDALAAQRMAQGGLIDKQGNERRSMLREEISDDVCIEFDHPHWQREPMHVVATNDTELGPVYLQAADAVRGVVLDAENRPLAARLVFRQSLTRGEFACSELPMLRETQSNETGSFTAHLPAGNYAVTVVESGEGASTVAVTVESGAELVIKAPRR